MSQPSNEGSPGYRWAEQLARWAIPEEILAQAPESPWGFPTRIFAASARRIDPDSISRRVAAEALDGGGSVIDVGCGGGAAGFALVPPASHLTGVDSSPELLASFDTDATAAGIPHLAVAGTWPDVAADVEPADVVVCHHVVYNVARIDAFVAALDDHARRRVVVELTEHHPLRATAPLWMRFWGLERPAGPTADDFIAVVEAAGLKPSVARRERAAHGADDPEGRAALVRRQLCLPPEREGEVAAALAEVVPPTVTVVTVWWDAR
jgi:SAM-dependent methyltransferase